MQNNSLLLIISIFISALIVVLIGRETSLAQPGPSYSVAYDVYPYSHLTLDDPTQEQVGLEDFFDAMQIQVTNIYLSYSYPIIRSEGRLIIINELNYHRFDLDYKDWDTNAVPVEDQIPHATGIDYNLIVMKNLNERWTLLTMFTPGIASDLEDDLVSDDFHLQVVVAFIRAHSERLQLGYGLAYSTLFGEPFPLPIIQINWNNGAKLSVESLLPANLDIRYMLSERAMLGFSFLLAGNQYHGAKSKYDANNPQLNYSVGNIVPSLRLVLSEKLNLDISTGMTMFRRLEFYDGTKKVQSYNMKNSAILRMGLTYGG